MSEQTSIRSVIENQIKNNNLKHAYLFCGGAGTGKAQPLDSLIMTIKGYVKIRDIKIGDILIDGLGKETKVIGIYPQGIKPVYKVTFSDKTSTLCSDEHIWKVGYYSNKTSSIKWNNLTLNEIMKRGLKKRNNSSGWKFRIPVPIIDCWTDNITLDPYILGVLLGDGDLGSSSNIKVSLYEEDVKEKIYTLLNNIGYELHICDINTPNIKDYNIVRKDKTSNGFIQYIQNLNLRCKSTEKHIPEQYLYSSINTRKLLLQGLFDTDGYIDSHNNYIFTTSSSRLSEDFSFLVRSLGGTDTIIEKPSGYKCNGKYIECQNHFDHFIKFDNNFEFCTSLKHKNKLRRKQNGPQRRIINIEYIGDQECQCIKVDSEDHTYMTNDLIVTHNTTCGRIVANMINKDNGLLIEIDCASNNGVEAMNNIKDECRSRPLSGGYKIFLLDECHMISVQGWNTMLKILEEPPEFVIFIMCTTDPQKIISTIMSRVQRFNFMKISTEGITNRLKYIIESENKDFKEATDLNEEQKVLQTKLIQENKEYIIYEEEAVKYIARLARGGMRDAITNLEKCLDYDRNLTLSNVHTVTSGGVSEEELLKFLRLILNKDAKGSLLHFNDIYMTGVDTLLFIKLYIEFLQNCLKYIITEDPNIVTISEITLNWLDQNKSFIEDMRQQLLDVMKIKTDYTSEDLKIILESWIIQICV